MACESCLEIKKVKTYATDGVGIGIILGLLGLTFVACYLSTRK